MCWFSRISLEIMKKKKKKKVFMTWFNTRDSGLIKNLCSQLPRLSFMEKVMLRVWWNHHGVIHFELFFLNHNHSMQTYILNSCNKCMKIFKENALHSSIGETFSFMITQGHIQQESHRKILDFGWVILSIIFTKPCT